MKEMFKVYILYSNRIKRFYVGSTKNLEDRVLRHNSGRSIFTKKGHPWKLITAFDCKTKTEAIQLEYKIKERGINRYLNDNTRGVAQSG